MIKMHMTGTRWIILGIGLFTVAVFAGLYWTAVSMFGTQCEKRSAKVEIEGPVKQEWAVRYHCKGGLNLGLAMALDNDGNVYVTGRGRCGGDCGEGYDYMTVKYSSSGKRLWVVRYNGPSKCDDVATAIAVDPAGNVYVTGRSAGNGHNVATVKYDANGEELWVARHSVGQEGHNPALVLDKEGNVYVSVHAGTTHYTWKYSGVDGSELWFDALESNPWNYWSQSMVVDEEGNVYIGTNRDVIKYNKDGRMLLAIPTQPDPKPGRWNTVALDRDGNIWAVGHNLAKYTAGGELVWTTPYYDESDPLGFYEVHAIVVNNLGEGYLVTNRETLKYAPDGGLLWTGTGGSAIAVDNMGNAYVADPGLDYVAKYAVDGTQTWSVHHNNGSARSIAVDGSGNVYAAGSVRVKFCSDPFGGGERWFTNYLVTKFSQ